MGGMMKKIRITGILGGILLFTQVLFATDLPDNLDFRKYKDIYLEAKQNSDQLREEADRAKYNLQDIQRNILVAQQQIDSKSRAIDGDRRSIRDMTERNRRYKNDIERLQRESIRSKDEILQRKSELRSLVERRDSLNARESELSSEIRNIQTNINEVSENIKELRQRKSDIQNRLESAKNKAQKIASRIENKRAKIKGIDDRIQSLKANISEKRNKLSQIEDKKSKKAKALKKQIANLVEKANEKKAEKESVKAEIDLLRGESSAAKEKVAAARARMQEVTAKINKIEEKLQPLKNKLAKVKTRISEVKDSLNKVRASISDKRNAIASLERKIINNKAQIERNRNSIESNKNSIARKENEIRELHSEIRVLSNRRDAWIEREQDAQAHYNRLDRLADVAELDTLRKQRKYQEVLTEYNVTVQEAKQEGSKWGNINGSALGEEEGSADGKVSGKEGGELKGEEDGLIFGFENGKNQGYLDGKNEGYESGISTPGKEEGGYEKGLEVGDLSALEEAKRVNYVQGKEDKRKELLERALSEVTLPNTTTISRSLLFAERKPSLARVNGNFLSHRLGDHPNHVSVDSLEFSLNASNAESVCRRLANEGVLHKPFTPTPFECNFTYTEMNNFCQESYEESFKDAFEESYETQYKSNKITTCVEYYDVKFEENKLVRHDEGYKLMYQPTFDEWAKKGASDIWNKGYARGYNEAYNENIAKYREEQYLLGKKDAEAFFANNPVIQLLEASYKASEPKIPGSVVAGDNVSLNLSFANFGFVPAQKGEVRVKVTSLTPSLSVPVHQEWIDITELEESAVSHVLKVANIQVSKSAVSREDAPFRVTVFLPNGEKYSKDFYISIDPYVQVEVTENYYHSPVPRTSVRISVYIKNTAQTTPADDLLVTLSVPPEFQKIAVVYRDSFVIKAQSLKPQQTIKGSLGFRVIKNLVPRLRPTIPLSLKVIFKGEVIKEKTIPIYPK